RADACRSASARTRTKYPVRWRWPARLPPACRGPRLRPGRNGVRRLLSSRSCWLLGLGFLRQRVCHEHQAMRAAAGGGFIVILRDEFCDGLGEFVGESRPIGRRREATLGIHRQGRQTFARLLRTTNEVAHLPDNPCAQGDEIARG